MKFAVLLAVKSWRRRVRFRLSGHHARPGKIKAPYVPNTQLPWEYLHPTHAGYNAIDGPIKAFLRYRLERAALRVQFVSPVLPEPEPAFEARMDLISSFLPGYKSETLPAVKGWRARSAPIERRAGAGVSTSSTTPRAARPGAEAGPVEAERIWRYWNKDPRSAAPRRGSGSRSTMRPFSWGAARTTTNFWDIAAPQPAYVRLLCALSGPARSRVRPPKAARAWQRSSGWQGFY
jgi:hypothetical protein